MDMNVDLVLGPIVLAVVANVREILFFRPVSARRRLNGLDFHAGRVVWDVCGAVVHVLDLWVQRPMAHQVGLFPPTCLPLFPIRNLKTSFYLNLGDSSSVRTNTRRIYPYMRSILFSFLVLNLYSPP